MCNEKLETVRREGEDEGEKKGQGEDVNAIAGVIPCLLLVLIYPSSEFVVSFNVDAICAREKERESAM